MESETVHSDLYTKAFLAEQFQAFKNYQLSRRRAKEVVSSVRLTNFPEDISENIVKWTLQLLGDTSISHKTVGKGRGDLRSSNDGKIEVKCFATSGPISFGPEQDWDILYVVDARKWEEEKFTIHRVALAKTSEKWQQLQFSKTRKFMDYGKERPRLSWSELLPQIQTDTTIIFDGTFQSIVQ